MRPSNRELNQMRDIVIETGVTRHASGLWRALPWGEFVPMRRAYAFYRENVLSRCLRARRVCCRRALG